MAVIKPGFKQIQFPADSPYGSKILELTSLGSPVVAVAIDLLHNSSNKDLSTTYKTVDVYSDGTEFNILKKSDSSALSEEEAKEYVKLLTGSEFVSTEDQNAPAYSYVLLASNILYRFKYISGTGLKAYKAAELGGGGSSSVAWGSITGSLSNQEDLMSFIGATLLGYVPYSVLVSYATQSWVSSNYLPLSGGTLSGSLYAGSYAIYAETIGTGDGHGGLSAGWYWDAETSTYNLNNNAGAINVLPSIYLSDTYVYGSLIYNNAEVATVNDIPSVYNADLTIQVDGRNVGSFTANASVSSTVNIEMSSYYLPLSGGRLYGGVLVQKDNSQGASVTIRAGENNPGAAYAQMYVTDAYQPEAGLKLADTMGTATIITPSAVKVLGNQYSIAFPDVSQNEIFATETYVQANPASTDYLLTGIKIGSSTYAIPSQSGQGQFVPYSGATSDVYLGNHKLNFGVLSQAGEGEIRVDSSTGDMYLTTSHGDIVLNPDGTANYQTTGTSSVAEIANIDYVDYHHTMVNASSLSDTDIDRILVKGGIVILDDEQLALTLAPPNEQLTLTMLNSINNNPTSLTPTITNTSLDLTMSNSIDNTTDTGLTPTITKTELSI